MGPHVEIIADTRVNWSDFKITVNKLLEKRPDHLLGSQIKVKDDAEYLLYLCAIFGLDITSHFDRLRHIPRHILDFLHYTMMVACSQQTSEEFLLTTRLNIIHKSVSREANFLLVTAPLSVWQDTIVLNLSKDWNYTNDTRLLLNKIFLLLERRGLGPLFDSYDKVLNKDNTFFLEKR